MNIFEMLYAQMDEVPHTHKCGFTLFANGPESLHAPLGCGYEWSHKRSDLQNAGAFEKGHTCPNCGLGPWTWQYCDDTAARPKNERDHAAERKARRERELAYEPYP
jgi:hypothetical protein